MEPGCPFPSDLTAQQRHPAAALNSGIQLRLSTAASSCDSSTAATAQQRHPAASSGIQQLAWPIHDAVIASHLPNSCAPSLPACRPGSCFWSVMVGTTRCTAQRGRDLYPLNSLPNSCAPSLPACRPGSCFWSLMVGITRCTAQLAGHSQVVEVLLAAGARIDVRDGR
jgi:hypothetical protein